MSIIEHASYYETVIHNVSHEHTSCELLYLINGRLEITAGEEIFQLENGDCALIKSRQHHQVKIAPEIEYKRFVAIINPWELKKQLVRPDLFSMLTDKSKSGIIVVRSNSSLRNCFERMAEIFADGGNIYEELSAALSVIATVYEVIKPKNEVTANHAGALLTAKIREYIEQNYADNIRIADLAAENFISSGYLTHTFKTETGMSPREYLSHIRCTRAYELIKHTAMKFCDISSATGFCCANDMSRKIHEYYGLTPSEIRYSC